MASQTLLSSLFMRFYYLYFHYLSSVSMNDDEIFHETSPENLSNVDISECVVNLGNRIMACPSPMKAHSLKEHIQSNITNLISNLILSKTVSYCLCPLSFFCSQFSLYSTFPLSCLSASQYS